jgi:hypothetical protein
LGELAGDDPVEGDFLCLQVELAQRTEEEQAGFGTAAKGFGELVPECCGRSLADALVVGRRQLFLAQGSGAADNDPA